MITIDTKKQQAKKPKTLKSKEELNATHRKNVAHDVDRIQHWCESLSKRISSRKYPMSQVDIDKVLLALSDAFKQVEGVAHPTEAQAKGKFTLD